MTTPVHIFTLACPCMIVSIFYLMSEFCLLLIDTALQIQQMSTFDHSDQSHFCLLFINPKLKINKWDGSLIRVFGSFCGHRHLAYSLAMRGVGVIVWLDGGSKYASLSEKNGFVSLFQYRIFISFDTSSDMLLFILLSHTFCKSVRSWKNL
jgi:hypothetical protein